MISATAWIRKGAAAPVPELFQMTEEQYQDIKNRAKFEIEDAKESLELCKAQKAQEAAEEAVITSEEEDGSPVEDMEENLAKFNLEGYSEEEEIYDDQDIIQATSNIDDIALGIEEDPYLKENNMAKDEEEEEKVEEDDLDDLHVRPTDNLLIACRTEDEVSYLEVYVYEEEEDNLYVHHDIMLPSFPLCTEWIGTQLASEQPTSHGNFAAIGTFEPEIEIWNLDMLEVPYPTTVLGQRPIDQIKKFQQRKKKSRSKSSCTGVNSEAHTDAVMSLSWNRLHSSLLLSGSADSTIKLWDITQSKAVRSFEHHTDKVQTLQWSPSDCSILASAAYDQKVVSFDCRLPNETLSWKLSADPECLKWNPHQSHCFAVSDESGQVLYFDTRAGGNSLPLFTLAAHAKPVTSIDWNPALDSCLLTLSADRSLRLWNVSEQRPICVISREVGVGKIFTGSFCFDSPNFVSIAGSKGILTVLNLFDDPTILEGFKGLQTR